MPGVSYPFRPAWASIAKRARSISPLSRLRFSAATLVLDSGPTMRVPEVPCRRVGFRITSKPAVANVRCALRFALVILAVRLESHSAPYFSIPLLPGMKGIMLIHAQLCGGSYTDGH